MVSGLQLLSKGGKKQVQGQVKQFLISGIQGWCFVLSSWGGGWGECNSVSPVTVFIK